jgi:hypothetical protein
VVVRILTQKRGSENAEVLHQGWGFIRRLGSTPCVPQKAHRSGFSPSSCRQWLQSIFVLRTTQDSVPYHLLTTPNSVT